MRFNKPTEHEYRMAAKLEPIAIGIFSSDGHTSWHNTSKEVRDSYRGMAAAMVKEGATVF